MESSLLAGDGDFEAAWTLRGVKHTKRLPTARYDTPEGRTRLRDEEATMRRPWEQTKDCCREGLSGEAGLTVLSARE